ncbi:replication initiation factor domain-containing protein [Octadecabacter sp.]|nr:replication initiation factor domain-containing protein [Octadecabacter sp.]
MAQAIRFFEDNSMRFGTPTSGGRGYGNGLPFFVGNDNEAVGFVASGSTTGGMPNVTIKGGHGLCASLAPEFQRAFPGVRATRIDVCLDLIGEEESFEDLLDMSEMFARARKKMAKPQLHDVDDEKLGRTFYLGSRESSVFLRVYEKGKAENAKLAKAGMEESANPNWIRIELQHQKIEGHKKVAFAAMTPSELVCVRDWPRFWIALAAKVLGLTEAIGKAARHKAEFEPVVRTLEKSARWGIRQYGPTFLKMALNKVIELDFDGSEAATNITEQRLVEEAVDVFRDCLSASGKAFDLIEDHRLDVIETCEVRTEQLAKWIQETRIEQIDKQAKRRYDLLKQVSIGSKDSDGIYAVAGSAARAENAARDAHQAKISGWQTTGSE